MLHIGCHLSSSKGYRHMGEDALSINAGYVPVFYAKPEGQQGQEGGPQGRGSPARPDGGARLRAVLGHAPYTLNACALDEGLRAFARDAMREDVMTLDTYLPHMLYNFHPGAMWGQGIERGMALIVELLDADPASGADHPRPAGNHVRQGDRGRKPFRGAGAHPPLGIAGRQDGRVPRHLPRLFGGV